MGEMDLVNIAKWEDEYDPGCEGGQESFLYGNKYGPSESLVQYLGCFQGFVCLAAYLVHD